MISNSIKEVVKKYDFRRFLITKTFCLKGDFAAALFKLKQMQSLCPSLD